MNRRKQHGIGLIEVMISLTIAFGLLAAAVALSRVARADADASRLIPDVSSLVREIRTVSGGALGAGYGGLTAETLYARSSVLSDAYTGSGSTAAYTIQRVGVQLGESAYALDAQERPMTTGRSGDSFFIRLDGLSPSLCLSVLGGLAPEATAATIRASTTDTPIAVRRHYDAAATASACGSARSARVTIHFN
ncbi:type IV pilus modification PilV family protein [Luteimonas sp. MHLX1A]|uniref:type IV pilus modification PilV family protein n=1 Tax=Alterluteimonas muca TaxID=2878684 RepID=UPI001E50E133|nr:prepilin-type N-terminal cleavage/methylation domain-containing protein [Luteimonas sp. MHLX1A]MCD9046771.1 hypothetical protein [Luteimonas sp. MHLX1A]